MLDRLTGGEATVGELALPLDISAPAVSKHLRILEDAGLVSRHRHGRLHRIRVQHGPLRHAGRWLEDRAELWTAALDELDRMIGEEHDGD